VTDFTMTSGDLDPTAGAVPPASQPAIRVSVAVVEAHAPSRERIMALLGDGVTPFTSLEELSARLTGAVPVVAVLGPSCSGEDSLALSERIMREYPLMASILIVDELTTQLLQQALRASPARWPRRCSGWR
jgi:hypothetical protein